MSEDAEKVHEASPDKKRRARTKGDVPVSAEANTAAALIGFLVALAVVIPQIEGVALKLRGMLMRPEAAAEALMEGSMAGEIILSAGFFLLPLTMFPAAGVLLSLGLQQSFVVAPQRIKPELKKLSPIAGIGKKFGPQALIEFAKNSLKVLVVIVVGSLVIWREAQRVIYRLEASDGALAALLLREMLVVLSVGAAAAVAFSILDIPLVRAQREKRLKMSQQEMRDEAKDSEGDGHLKAQRRQRAEKIASGRMLNDVRGADVLVVNPTHFAVALSWDRGGEELPRCVAKGTDELALRLRQVARDEGIPIRDDPPTARMLHAAVQVGDPIRPEHFAAVAAAIRFADRIRSRRR